MSGLDYTFEPNGRVLVLLADVAAGWRRSERLDAKSYFFGESVSLEWQGRSIHATLSAFPRPGGLNPAWATPPVLQEHPARRNTDTKLSYLDADERRNVVEDPIAVAVVDGFLRVFVELLDDQAAPHPGLNVAKRDGAGRSIVERFCDERVQGRVFSTCQVQVRLKFEPPERPAPIYRSFWNRFLPGGHPESNRRRF